VAAAGSLARRRVVGHPLSWGRWLLAHSHRGGRPPRGPALRGQV